MTKLVIIRHGNTFGPDETPRRVGKRTDIPLVESGVSQALELGQYFRKINLFPDVIYTSSLVRTQQTAQHILLGLEMKEPTYPLHIFDEIDYGPDENKEEDEVVARIGQDAIDKWNEEALVPADWEFDSQQMVEDWKGFANQIIKTGDEETVFVVTSNGIARFAPHITGDFEAFKAKHLLKLRTGAYGILQHDYQGWQVQSWGQRPE